MVFILSECHVDDATARKQTRIARGGVLSIYELISFVFLLFILTLAYHTSRLGNVVHDLAFFVLTSQLSYEVET
jgi:hypothetical protein